MKLLALLSFTVLAVDVVVASAFPARHHRIARRLNRKKRCLARPHTQNDSTNAELYHPAATSPPITHPTYPTTTTPKEAPSTSPPPSNQPQSGVINVGSTCGDIGATTTPTKTSGPNGSIGWLNCGIQGSGWTPPQFSVDQVISQDLNDVLSRPGNPYEACRPHIDAFYKSAKQYGVPAILIAAIAMQESSCDASTIGHNSEQGLMQITSEKCPGGYVSDACMEPWTNIDIGTHYLRTTLDTCGGNLPLAIGEYNGWFVGMTEYGVTHVAKDKCFAQQNLDYLHQTLNGWLQGIDPRAQGMGTFFNLDQCNS